MYICANKKMAHSITDTAMLFAPCSIHISTCVLVLVYLLTGGRECFLSEMHISQVLLDERTRIHDVHGTNYIQLFLQGEDYCNTMLRRFQSDPNKL